MNGMHVMLDLETLSTLPNAMLLSIGAVKFAPEYFGYDDPVYDKFYQVVRSDKELTGFDINDDTLKWWTQQSEEARAVFADPNAVDLDTALHNFFAWVTRNADRDDVRMWGNGSSFDNVILSTAYRLRGFEQPWRFWNDRCYRTVKNMYPKVDMVRVGTHHNALADAESQARHLLQMGVPLA